MNGKLPSIQIANKRIGLTGGAGFVGSAIARRLAPANHVEILDLGVHGPDHPAVGGAKIVTGDVRNRDAVDALVADCDVVIHLASIAGVHSVVANPVATMETVLLGAQNVLNAVRDCPAVERLIIFSTSEVAGRFAYNAREDQTLHDAASGELRWTYAVSKLASEFLAAAHHAESGLPVVSLRPFNIYGPGQLGSGAIREFVRAAVQNRPLTVNGDGAQIRAWCYIDDVVDAVVACCCATEAVGEVLNVGNPRSVVTVSELARLVVRLAESDSEIRYVPNEEVDVALRVPDITKARRIIGFEPRVDLDEGIGRTIAAQREDSATV